MYSEVKTRPRKFKPVKPVLTKKKAKKKTSANRNKPNINKTASAKNIFAELIFAAAKAGKKIIVHNAKGRAISEIAPLPGSKINAPDLSNSVLLEVVSSSKGAVMVYVSNIYDHVVAFMMTDFIFYKIMNAAREISKVNTVSAYGVAA